MFISIFFSYVFKLIVSNYYIIYMASIVAYIKHYYTTYNNNKYPYKNIIMIPNDIDKQTLICKLNKLYDKNKNKHEIEFNLSKFIISFSQNRTFNTIIYASSLIELNTIIKYISTNGNLYHKKLFGHLPTTILEKIIITTNNCEIDITDIITNFIEYQSPILFNDAILLKEIIDKIINIKIIYHKDMEETSLILDYDEYKHKNIDDINFLF